MKRIFTLLLAMAMAATTLGGCSLKKEKPTEPVPTVDSAINIQLGGEPNTLDPAFAATTAEESYIIHLFEGLTTLDDRLEAQPAVAESWERLVSDAGEISYTFKLSANAKWSDGEAVKAEDFIYAWKRVVDPATKSPLAYRLYPIKGAKAIHEDSGDIADFGAEVKEDGSLVVTLEGECPDFLQRLATAPWMPLRESMVKAKPNGWYYDAEKFLANGPYRLDKWERDTQITMVRSDNYRDSKNVKAKKLNFVLSEDEEAIMAAYKGGTVQLATNLPLMDIEALPSENLRRDTLLGSYVLAFNTAHKPFDDARVRSALSLAIDRKAIAAVLRDGSIPAEALIPKGAVVGGEDLRKKGGKLIEASANPEEAKKLLAEAGYENGKGIPTIKFLVNDEEVHGRIAAAVAKMWEPLGITVETDVQGWDDYLVMREDGKFDVTRGAIFSDALYPSAFLDNWTGESPLNYTSYNSADYNTLIDLSYGRKAKTEAKPEADEKTDDKKTEDKKPETAADKKVDGETAETAEEAEKAPIDCLTEAEKLLVKTDSVLAPLTWYTNRYAVASGLVGITSYPTGYMYFGGASYSKPAEK
ncbi:MAG: peptide ABC transporter substrate-binding protein [Angelakisella sp.]